MFEFIFYNVLIPLIALGVVIFIHELGHFLVAIKCGIAVEKFSIGFGPKIYAFNKNGTEYRVSLFLFGGYVKFLGDELDSEDQGPPPEGGFYSVSPLARIYTAFAGPAVNLVFGLLLYTIVFLVGRPVVSTEMSTQIGRIQKESPAEKAGIQPGDKIVQIFDKKIDRWIQVLEEIALSTDSPILIKIQRDNQEIDIPVIPVVDEDYGIKRIGISVWDHVRVGVFDQQPAFIAGLKDNDEIISVNGNSIFSWEEFIHEIQKNEGEEILLQVLRGEDLLFLNIQPQKIDEEYRIGVYLKPEVILSHPNPWTSFYHDVHQIFRTLKGLIFREVSAKGLAGPVGIIQIMGSYAKLGFISFCIILAMISINLGVLNLLPIPVLDGGHILFSLIEWIRGKSMSKKAMIIFQNIFVSLLILMIVLVTFNDINRTRKQRIKKHSQIENTQSIKEIP